eukprot:12343068-Prorocentrum_lima.AAC.1
MEALTRVEASQQSRGAGRRVELLWVQRAPTQERARDPEEKEARLPDRGGKEVGAPMVDSRRR